MEWICRIFLCVFVLNVPRWITASSRFRSTPFMPGWFYQFHDKDKTLCPMYEGSNAKIGLWDSCDEDIDHTLWKVVQGTEIDTFTLVNLKTRQCMTAGINMEDTGNNTPVVQYECQNPPSLNQLWSYQILTIDEIKFALLKCGDRCISNHNPEPGTTFYMYDCDGSSGQLMRIS